MSNTLLPNSLNNILSSWKSLGKAVRTVADAENDSPVFPADVFGLRGSLTGFYVSQYIERKHILRLNNAQYNQKFTSVQEDCVIIVPSTREAMECESDLRSILGDEADLFILPWWDMVPYRPSAKGAQIFGKRAGVLYRMAVRNGIRNKPRIFIVPYRSFVSPLPPPSYIKGLGFSITRKHSFDSAAVAEKLVELGYMRVSRVSGRGEFALRGEVLDIFLPGEENPYRITFEFDDVEQIKTFDIETQGSMEKLESVFIYPMKEVVWTDELADRLDRLLAREDEMGIVNDFATFDEARKHGEYNVNPDEKYESAESDSPSDDRRRNVHLAFTDNARKEKERIVTELMVNRQSEGEEFFYGYLWDKVYTLADYLFPETTVFCYDYDRLLNSEKLVRREYEGAYRTARQIFPVLPPDLMVFPFRDILGQHRRSVLFRSIETVSTDEISGGFRFDLCSEPALSFFGNINYFKEQLTSLQNDGWRVYIFADNSTQSLRISEVVKSFIFPENRNVYPVEVMGKPLTEGFSVAEEKILLLQENAIFGRKKVTPKAFRKVPSKAIDSFVELHPGDYVVHAKYGIGLFEGIERVKAFDSERDFIKLEYDDKEFLYVPIEQVNMVQRYIGNEGSKPRLDNLGSKSWNARKAKVQKKVEEIAEKLVDLYSKRMASKGHAFPKDEEMQATFEAAFPYEDTPDQYTATQDIKADMESNVPMDRLVCGDVGYGKTEIAMRAAFKAVMGGKQVAFLAPTTILAEQHYENCIERFKNFPVTVAHMSRFVPSGEQKKIKENLREGAVDILVGTHKILQKDIVYKDLGLVIIDEEQRFGVKDKEKLKEMKTNIDCLTMSATPIPRTLHMSLLKIRDMSLLTTPPQNRQPIETVIDAYSDEKVAKVIRQEVERGGQVFYLHNRVETLDEVQIKLEHLVPEMLIETAHGQMTSDELDDIFKRFKMGAFHVLVATTIIENGIDIPNVNTIIIDRADMYGVSQLYQLRGRVGRCEKKAYAYLLYPENKALSEVAMKRLQVISDFTELGSGFKIAMKDMEIRGAGNLLGKDQSGEVCAVGFEMYLNLLNAAIERLHNSNWQAPEEVYMELEYSGFIPDEYISDAQIKMEMYKKISGVSSGQQVDAISEELFDRFGPLPVEVNNLLNISKIRAVCTRLGIRSLKEKKGLVTVEFTDVTKISIEKLMNLIKLNKNKIEPEPANPNILYMRINSIDLKTKCEFIRSKLEFLV